MFEILFYKYLYVEEEKSSDKIKYEYYLQKYSKYSDEELLEIRYSLIAENIEEVEEILLQQKVIDDIINSRKKKDSEKTTIKEVFDKYFYNITTLLRLFNLQKVNISFQEILKLTEKEIEIILLNINQNPYKGLL